MTKACNSAYPVILAQTLRNTAINAVGLADSKGIEHGGAVNHRASCYTSLMTKSELIRCLSERFPALTAVDAEIAVNLILKQLAEHLRSGERIEIRGFGRLALDDPSPGKGPNRKRYSTIEVPDRQVVDVEPAWECRDRADTLSVPATTKPLKYTLDELLAQCDPDAPSPRIPGWDEMVPVGKEIL